MTITSKLAAVTSVALLAASGVAAAAHADAPGPVGPGRASCAYGWPIVPVPVTLKFAST
jgi:hypothetical protein